MRDWSARTPPGSCSTSWVGWSPSRRPPKVDTRKHQTPLVRALLARIESERNTEVDREASIGERAEAKVRAGQLAALLQQVEEGGA